MSYNFAIIGAGGYIAPRHLKAIQDTGNCLVAASDPHDAVGILDRFSFDARFFPEIERFDRHLEKLRRGPAENRVNYVSICSPNYLHDAHVRLALRIGAHAICEKPLVINPWNLDALSDLEHDFGKRVFTILQLRVHPALTELKQRLSLDPASKKHEVVLTYITGRGAWYLASWKGNEEKSGGLAVNIGIHFFDLLMWLFGKADRCEVHVKEPRRMSGFLELAHANVRWFLSIDSADLQFKPKSGGQTTLRSITLDGKEIEFSQGFTDLHTRVYERLINNEGFGIDDARPSIELVYRIRTTKVDLNPEKAHPNCRGDSLNK